jgi:hypothetical protein
MKAKVLSLFFILALGFNTSAQENADFEKLINWMTGSFDSEAQAKNDTAYENFSLEMERIWEDKPNGAWIYVEQALASKPDEPSRQSIYFVSQITDGEYSSDIYELNEPEKFVGAYDDSTVFEDLSVFDLKFKEGCTVFLNYDGYQFSGQSNEETCKSTIRDAAYATSEVVFLPDKIKSWDRGFNEEGQQVWGAEKRAYIFEKR